jgi:UDP-glucuronate 4-epimerase
VHALVTGCAGFVGSHLTDSLLGRGDRVRGVDAFTEYYDPERKRRNIQRSIGREGFELIDGDLRYRDLLALLDGVDVVFHVAGQPGVRVSWGQGFDAYVGNNVIATQRLLEAVRERPVRRLVYASSSSVYGNAARYPTTETDLPRPHSPYGVTKLAAEHLCNVYAANWAVSTISLRYFTVYGPRQRPDMAFSRFIDAAIRGLAVKVFGDGEQIRDFTYVSDVVAATMAAGDVDVEPGSVFNVTGGSSVAVRDVLAVLSELLGIEIRVERADAQAGDVRQTGGSIERIRAELGWAPTVPLRDGLSNQIAWTRGSGAPG